MSNTTLTPGLHWAHPSVYMYVHMYVTMSSRFLYKVYTITPVQCHTPVAVSLHMDTGGLQGMDYLQLPHFSCKNCVKS